MKKNRLIMISTHAETKASTTEEKPLPWSSEGIPEGWSMQSMQEKGMEALLVSSESGASWPLHHGPDEWIGYMLEGSITLILADEQEKSPEEVILHAGDVMSFDAYCHHGWRNDENTKALMLFVRRMN